MENKSTEWNDSGELLLLQCSRTWQELHIFFKNKIKKKKVQCICWYLKATSLYISSALSTVQQCTGDKRGRTTGAHSVEGPLEAPDCLRHAFTNDVEAECHYFSDTSQFLINSSHCGKSEWENFIYTTYTFSQMCGNMTRSLNPQSQLVKHLSKKLCFRFPVALLCKKYTGGLGDRKQYEYINQYSGAEEMTKHKKSVCKSDLKTIKCVLVWFFQ